MADVRGEPLPELVQAGQVQLARGQAGHPLADPDVIGEHGHDGVVGRVADGGERGQQYLLLDPEVLGAVLIPEHEDAVSHLGEVVGARPLHQHRAVEGLVVVVREMHQRRIPLHRVPVTADSSTVAVKIGDLPAPRPVEENGAHVGAAE